MNVRRRTKLRPDKIEWLLIGVIVILFVTGAILLVFSPAWWGWYLQVLDTRYWSSRGWVCAVAALVYILLVIRYWPKRNRKRTESDAKTPTEAP